MAGSIYTPIIETTSSSGSLYSFIGAPLLTQYSVASRCSQNWVYEPNRPGYVWSDFVRISTWSACQPYYDPIGIYSPGICPLGQKFGAVVKDINQDESGAIDTRYTGYCCWSDFNWEVLADTRIDTRSDPWCMATLYPPVTAWLSQHSGSAPTATVLNSTITAVGAFIQMWWHESDLSLFPESLAASMRVGMGLPAFPTSSTTMMPTGTGPTPTSTDSRPQNSPVTISKATIAGIGAGVGVAVLLIGALGYLALSRRWKAPRAEVEQQNGTPPARETSSVGCLRRIMRRERRPLPNLPEMEQGQNIHKYFSGGAWRTELHGTQTRNPEDSLQVGPRHGSTMVVGEPVELDGSPSVRQETVPGAGPAVGHGQ